MLRTEGESRQKTIVVKRDKAASAEEAKEKQCIRRYKKDKPTQTHIQLLNENFLNEKCKTKEKTMAFMVQNEVLTDVLS